MTDQEDGARVNLEDGWNVTAFRYYGEHQWRVVIRKQRDEVARYEIEVKTCYAALTDGIERVEKKMGFEQKAAKSAKGEDEYTHLQREETVGDALR